MAIDWGLGYRAPDDSVAAALQAFGTGRQLALQQQTQQRGENLRTAVRAAYNPGTGALDPHQVEGAIADYGDPAELIQYHQQADAEQQAKHAKTVQEIGRAAEMADTPQKWDAAVDYLAANVDPALARYKGQFSPENRMAAIAAAGQFDAWHKSQQPVISHAGDVARDPTTGAVVYENPEKTKYIPTGDGRIAVISPDGNIGFQGGAAGAPASGGTAGGGGVAPRSVRNNNPGNIEDGPFAKGLPGYQGSDGRFAIFATPDAGRAAQIHLLQSYGSRGINTVAGIVNRWAPPSDGNDTSAYAARVASSLGVDPNKPIDMHDPQVVGRIADIMAGVESGGSPVKGGQPASGGPRVAFVGEARQDKAPAGYRWKGEKLEAIPGGPADAAVLSPDVLRSMAEQYLAGDKSIFQNLGRGTQGAANIVRLRGEVARQMAAANMNGRDVAAKMAEFSGLVAGERTVGTRAANIEMAADEASRIIPLAREASHAFPRNGFTPLARAMQAVASGTNDPRLRRFVTANTALVNVYARAITPSGQPHESDKQHARAMLDTAYDQPSYDAVLDQMEKEIQAAQRAPGDVRAGLRTAITGDTPTPDRSPARAGNAPQIGEVRRGYKYKGGPPGSPSSWQKM